MRIANKIFAITFLISSLAVSGIAVLTIMSATDALRDLTKKRLFDNVGREAGTIQSSVEAARNDIAMLGGRGALGALADLSESFARDNLKMLGDQIDAMMRKRGMYKQIQIVMTHSGVHHAVFSTRIGDKVRTFLDPPVLYSTYHEILREPQGLRSEDILLELEQQGGRRGMSGSKQVLYYSFPIIDNNSETIGAIAVIVDFDALVRGMGNPNDRIDYYVTDSKGRYLFSSTHEPNQPGKRVTANIVDDFKLHGKWTGWMSQEESHFQDELADRSMAVDFHRIELLDGKRAQERQVIVVGGAVSLDDVEMYIVHFRSQLAVVVLGAGALMALALALATLYLTRPIGELTKAANRIAAGDRNVVAPIDQQDEIGVLARAVMRMAQSLRNSAKNEEQAAMGRMATMIAHDLRNALSSVKMNVKILHTHHRDAGDDYTDGCEIALDQVRYMESILNDLLAFARSGSMDLDWVDIGETIRTATVSLLPEITRRSIHVIEASGQKLPTVLGDRNKLLQMFQNLLDNAVQAAPEGGHVSIEAQSILHNSHPSVEIRIADDGKGIPPEDVEKVFEPFFTTRARGTGLGLSIVQKIVKQHGGEVSLNPGKTGGTVATVILPLSSAASNQEDEPAPSVK